MNARFAHWTLTAQYSLSMNQTAENWISEWNYFGLSRDVGPHLVLYSLRLSFTHERWSLFWLFGTWQLLLNVTYIISILRFLYTALLCKLHAGRVTHELSTTTGSVV
jgi:hypothetical protein